MLPKSKFQAVIKLRFWRDLLNRGEAERKRNSRSAVVVAAGPAAAAADAACGGMGHETLADGPDCTLNMPCFFTTPPDAMTEIRMDVLFLSQLFRR